MVAISKSDKDLIENYVKNPNFLKPIVVIVFVFVDL